MVLNADELALDLDLLRHQIFVTAEAGLLDADGRVGYQADLMHKINIFLERLWR